MLYQLTSKVLGTRSFRNQSGNIVLYLILLTPISLTLGLVTVDILRWHALGSNLQLKADRISLAAAQLLPDTEAARRYIEKELNETNFIQYQNKYEINLNPSQVSLSLDVKLQSISPLPVEATKNSSLFTQKRYSRAEISPVELVVIAQDGESLRPQPFSFWARSLDGNYRINSCLEGNSDFNICKEEWKAQNCLNPSFGELKLGLAKLISEVNRIPANQASILFWPGDYPNQGFSKFNFREKTNKSFSEFYVQPRNELRDHDCLDIANSHPNIRSYLDQANNSRELSLLSRVIREDSISGQQKNLEEIINTAICEFSGVCQADQQPATTNKNLTKQRVLLVMTDTLPISSGSLANIFDLLQKIKVKPFFLAWSHPAINPEERASLQNKIEFIRQLNPDAGFLANSNQELRTILQEVLHSDIQEVTLGR